MLAKTATFLLAAFLGVVSALSVTSSLQLGSSHLRTVYASGSLCVPASGTLGWLYGAKPASEGGGYHNGVDIWGTAGVTPIYAAADGDVSIITTSYGGTYVRLHHAALGLWTFYDHMGSSNITVADGAHVLQGRQIGYVGLDQANGVPHVHFAVNNQASETAGTPGNVDPSPLLGVNVSYPRPPAPAFGAAIASNCATSSGYADGTLLRGQPSNTLHLMVGGAQFFVQMTDCPTLALNCATGFQDVSDATIANLPTVPNDATILRGQPSNTLHLVYGGAQFFLSMVDCQTLGLNCATGFHDITDAMVGTLPSVPKDATILRGQPSNTLHLIFGGAQFFLSMVDCQTLGLNCATGFHDITDAMVGTLPSVPRDATILRGQPSNTLHLVYGGAQFFLSMVDCQTLSLNCATGFRDITDTMVSTLPTVPVDGTLLKEPSNASEYVVYGGKPFSIPTQQVLVALGLGSAPLHVVPDGGIGALPAVPADGTLLKELSTASEYIVYGGKPFGIPTQQVLIALGLGSTPLHIVPDGAIGALPAVPADGTLLKELSTASEYIVYGGKPFGIPTQQVLIALGLGSTPLGVVPDGALGALPAVPADGTLLRELSSPSAYLMCWTTKAMVGYSVAPADVHLVPDNALSSFFIGALALVPDSCTCPSRHADVDGDGVVSILDLSRVAQVFGQHIPPAPTRYDQDGDNQVTILDLSKMAKVFTQLVSACP